MNTSTQQFRALFKRHPTVAVVYLYGSRARGQATKKSDFDFAVYFNQPDVVKRHDTLFQLSSELSKLLKTDDIDLVSLNDVHAPALKFRIIQDGKVVFEREPHRLLIEPRILNEYFDFRYLLEKYGLSRRAA